MDFFLDPSDASAAPEAQPAGQDSSYLDTLLFRLQGCVNYHTLMAMEKEFNQVGLTLQTTSQNWVVLCQIVNSRPTFRRVMDDYIFVTPMSKVETEISPRAMDALISFVQSKHGQAQQLSDSNRTWRNGVQVYDKAIVVVNESINRIASQIVD